MRTILILTLLMSLSGCVSPPESQAFRFPAVSDTSYVAADGRVWVAYESRRIGERSYVVAFTPEIAERGKWTEILRFEYQPRLPTVEQVTAISEEVKQKDDSGFTYELTPTPSGYILKHHAPRWNESGISKTVFRDDGGVQISYMSRLTVDSDKRLEFWTSYITNLPNQALQPTHMLVTDRADARSAPSIRVADL